MSNGIEVIFAKNAHVAYVGTFFPIANIVSSFTTLIVFSIVLTSLSIPTTIMWDVFHCHQVDITLLWTISRVSFSTAALFAPVIPTLQFKSLSTISLLIISRMALSSGFTSISNLSDAI